MRADANDPRLSVLRALGKARLAPFDERARALLDVTGMDTQRLVAILHRNGLLEARGVDVRVEAFLGEPEPEWRSLDHLLCESRGCRVEIVIGHDLRNEP